MPHLQFELNFPVSKEEKVRFAHAVIGHFSTIMDTGTDHIGITFRQYAHDDLVFGRATPSGGRIAFLNADIRVGRSKEQKRRLALAIIDELAKRFGLAREAVYVVYTERDGEGFQLSDRVLPSWTPGEDPLADKKR